MTMIRHSNMSCLARGTERSLHETSGKMLICSAICKSRLDLAAKIGEPLYDTDAEFADRCESVRGADGPLGAARQLGIEMAETERGYTWDGLAKTALEQGDLPGALVALLNGFVAHPLEFDSPHHAFYIEMMMREPPETIGAVLAKARSEAVVRADWAYVTAIADVLEKYGRRDLATLALRIWAGVADTDGVRPNVRTAAPKRRVG
jgi:hypothetical protein